MRDRGRTIVCATGELEVGMAWWLLDSKGKKVSRAPFNESDAADGAGQKGTGVRPIKLADANPANLLAQLEQLEAGGKLSGGCPTQAHGKHIVAGGQVQEPTSSRANNSNLGTASRARDANKSSDSACCTC